MHVSQLYPLAHYQKSYLQPKSLELPESFFSFSHKNSLVERLFDFELTTQGDLQGVLGELLATQLLSYNLEKKLSLSPRVSGKFIGAEPGFEDFVIQSKGGLIFKSQEASRVVILEKDRIGRQESKFGFRPISELDGIYQIKRKNPGGSSQKQHVLVEVKTGELNLQPSHVIDHIFDPCSQVYGPDLSYLILAFKEDLYAKKKGVINKHNLLSKKVQNFYEQFHSQEVPITLMHFPFSKEKFLDFSHSIHEELQGYRVGRARFDELDGKLEFIDRDGNKITGKFIPDYE